MSKEEKVEEVLVVDLRRCGDTVQGQPRNPLAQGKYISTRQHDS